MLFMSIKPKLFLAIGVCLVQKICFILNNIACQIFLSVSVFRLLDKGKQSESEPNRALVATAANWQEWAKNACSEHLFDCMSVCV